MYVTRELWELGYKRDIDFDFYCLCAQYFLLSCTYFILYASTANIVLYFKFYAATVPGSLYFVRLWVMLVELLLSQFCEK